MFKGTIRISRYSSSREPYQGISIALVDGLSGDEFCSIKMPIEALGLAMTDGGADCEFVPRPDNIGKRRERKTEFVLVPDPTKGHYAQARAAVRPVENDGWKGDLRNFGNPRLQGRDDQGREGYRVGFTRFVDPVDDLLEEETE